MKREMPDKQKQRDLIPVMDYGQYRQARKLVHECCNYDNGQNPLMEKARAYVENWKEAYRCL